MSYALFIVIAGDTIRRLEQCVSQASPSASCVMMLTHFVIVRSAAELTRLPGRVYIEESSCAIFGTVLPFDPHEYRLRRAGSPALRHH